MNSRTGKTMSSCLALCALLISLTAPAVSEATTSRAARVANPVSAPTTSESDGGSGSDGGGGGGGGSEGSGGGSEGSGGGSEGSGGGGVDGSGGDTEQSSLAQVNAALREELAVFGQRLTQLYGRYTYLNEYVFNYQFGRGVHALVAPIANADRSWRLGQHVRFTIQDEPCTTRDGHRAGSSTGNFDSGVICLSRSRLMRLPPRVLNEEIVKLMFHEYSHLAGVGEIQAIRIASVVLANRELHRTNLGQGFSPAIRSCNTSQMWSEAEKMNESPYWRAQGRRLAQLLSGSKRLNCPGVTDNSPRLKLSIFADDNEYMHTTRKFDRSYVPPTPLGNSASSGQVYMTIDSVQNVTAVASLRVMTDRHELANINGLIGSAAQCSPKVLLSNVIASVADSLEMGCNTNSEIDTEPGHVRARVEEEERILRNAPRSPR